MLYLNPMDWMVKINDKKQLPPLTKAPLQEDYPPTFAEKQMIIEQTLSPDSVAYNIQLAYEVTGILSVPKLNQSLNALAQIHPIFRSYYAVGEGEFTHKISSYFQCEVEEIPCQKEAVQEEIRSRNIPFDVTCSTLLRCHLFTHETGVATLHFCIHHSIMDFVSSQLFFQDLFALYGGEEVQAPQVDYFDYALWQEQNLDLDQGKTALAQIFPQGFPEVEMPIKGQRPSVLPVVDTSLKFTISRESLNAKEVRDFPLFLGVLGITLSKYCGSEEVVIGTAMGGRNSAQENAILGMFVNSMPIPVKAELSQSVGDYFRQVTETVGAVKAQQSYPFSQIVADYATDRTQDRAPLFDVMINFLPEQVLPEGDGFSLTRLPMAAQQLAMDIMVEVEKHDTDFKVRLSYSSQLYSDVVMENFAQQFRHTLTLCCESHGSATIAEVTTLPESQTQVIMEQFQGDMVEGYRGESIVSLFQKQVASNPENLAVVADGKKFTYAQLHAMSDNLAQHLQEKGVKTGDTVGIMVGRTAMMAIAPLAVLKLGCAYLPMDPSYPPDRLNFMLGDVEAKFVVIDSPYLPVLEDYSGELIPTESLWDLPQSTKSLPLPNPEGTMVYLYTSGTTGNPKGVILTQQNILTTLHHHINTVKMTSEDNMSGYASFGFDGCLFETYPPLLTGACFTIIPDELRLDLYAMAEFFKEQNVTISFMTTQVARQFADTMEVPCLRILVTGGEALSPVEPPKHTKVLNAYGPTECSIFATLFPVDKLYSRIPIGHVVENTQIYILDSLDRHCPVGVAGELCIAGRQVAKGYLNRPDITAEKFVPNPYAPNEDYSHIYRTGDVARFLPNGNLDFVGRQDFQVKIRGFRVELTEIEGKIRTYPGITDATVLAQDLPTGGKRVVCYFVAEEQIEISALHDYVGAELPPYMVPSASMQLDKIPLTANGKVNRRTLPEIQMVVEELVATQGETEELLEKILAQALQQDAISATADLMYLGLTSILAIKVATQITKATGKQLSARDMMREKTIRALATMLDGTTGESPVKTYPIQEHYPLTQNQLGVYFACITDPQSLAYHIPFALKFHQNTSFQKVENALRTLLAQHPYLKSCLVMVDGKPMQLRQDNAPLELEVITCTQQEFENKKASFVQHFEFLGGALYRLALISTEQGVYLLCDFHHIIFDGGSLDSLLRALTALYRGEKGEEEQVSAYDIALQEEEARQGGGLEKAKDFFATRFGDLEGATQLPTQEQTGIALGTRLVLATVARKEIDGPSATQGLTPANVFLASTLLVLGRFASTSSVRIATIANGRDKGHLQDTFGMLVQTLAISTELEGEKTALHYLKDLQEELLATIDQSLFSYMELADAFSYQAQVLFAYQGGVIDQEDDFVQMEPLQEPVTKFPISVQISQEEDSYTVNLSYNAALFPYSFMETLGESIAYTAQNLLEKSQACLSRLSVLTPGQASKIQAFQQNLVAPSPWTLPELFQGQVEKTPTARAIYTSEITLSYTELNEKANQIAHALLERGVETGDKVAFILPRSYRILATMLGIAKAGCAYIPIDPEYPADRIAHVVEDSQAKYLLCDEIEGKPNALDIETLLSHPNKSNPEVAITPQNLCYLIYTSGSTGKPKGVMISHENIVNYVINTPENRHVTALVEQNATMVSVTTVSFDMFLKEAYTTLMNGLCLVLADDQQAKNPDQLAILFGESGGTAFNATPSRLLQYLEFPEIREALAQCKVIMAGGEGYPPVLYEKLREITQATLINTYGPTEISVSSNGKILESKEITIGRPLHNVQELVMDIHGNPLPIGVCGELWIGGTGVGQGYYGNPETTAEKFVVREGIPFYKSGDLARQTPTGEVEILGRNDGQIKLRGLRIELGEIERTLASYPNMGMVTVFVGNIHKQEHLVAYYTAKNPIEPVELREFLLKTLTTYMVPTAYLQLDSLPTTPNGKIDRKALPPANLMQQRDYVAPTNQAEEDYCQIFAQILSLETVGITDHFFELGGSSLLVTQVTLEASKKGYKLNYGDVFAHPSPKELASLAESTTNTPEKTEDLIALYDYTAIHKLLEKNTLEELPQGEARPLGNVCITGATGYLGIHILYEYLKKEKGTAFCVERGGKRTGAQRLKTLLAYYFEEDLDHLLCLWGTRIRVIEGEITQADLFERLATLPIDTYLNCAANVKHFSAGNDIEEVNLHGVEKAIAFAKEKKCRLIQVSTASVAGMSIENNPPESYHPTETALYFGQDLSNQYVHSKFLAERALLEAVATQGLDGKIMRVGNLMAREDGEFQVNFSTNNFLGRLRAYTIVGKVPYSALSGPVEFSPINDTAKAILALATTPKERNLFHPYNHHTLVMGDIITTLNQAGLPVICCEEAEYQEAVQTVMRQPEKAQKLNSLIAYAQAGKRVVPIKTDNLYTTQMLYRQDFWWQIPSSNYVKQFVTAMQGLGYFDVT